MKLSFSISLCLHAGLILCFMFMPDLSRSQPPQLVSIQILEEPKPKAPPKTEDPKPEEARQPEPEKPKTQPKQPDKKQEALEKLRKQRRQRKQSNLPTPKPTPRRKQPTRTPLPTPNPNFKPISDAKPPTSSPAATPSEETPVQFMDSSFTDMGYAGRLKRAILHQWNKPSVRTKSDYGREVTIEFKIRPSGLIIGIDVRRSSGWKALDDSAREAVESLEKFEAPPDNAYRGGSLGVRYKFRLSETGD